MKRNFKTSVAIVMILALLSGCATKEAKNNSSKTADLSYLNSQNFPIVNKKITLNMMGSKSSIQGEWGSLSVLKKYAEMTNIDVVWDTPANQNYQEKKNLILASGEYGDAFFGGNIQPQDEMNYGAQGVFIPLEGLIEKYAPNFKKLMEKFPEIKSSITAPDGHIYSLPRVSDVARDMTTKIWINQEWLKKLDMKMPTTISEFYEVLKAFRDKDPNGNGKKDEIPLSSVEVPVASIKLADVEEGLLCAFGFVGNKLIQLKDDKMTFVPIQNEYKEYLKFMNKIYAEKLLDPDAFTQSQPQAAKGKNMVLGVFASPGSFLIVPPEKSGEYVALPPLTSDVNKTKMWSKSSGISRGQFAITNKNKYPEATMRWVDYFYSEEGGNFMFMGNENEDYKWTDSTKTEWERIVPAGMNPEEYRGGKVTPDCGTAIPCYQNANFASKQKSKYDKVIDTEVANNYVPYWKNVTPLFYYTTAQQKRLDAISTDIYSYFAQMRAKFILGGESFDNWDKYIEELNKMGVSELIEINQKAYDVTKSVK